MQEDFRKFLKQGGRSPNAIERILAYVEEFHTYLVEHCGRDLQTADQGDLEAFVAQIEQDPKTSAKGQLWGLGYFFTFTGDENLGSLAGMLREQRIERRPFPIRKFRGLDPGVVNKLEAVGIKHVKQVLAAGATEENRQALAARADVPEDAILEVVKLADLARIPGIKGIRARLYHDAGVDTLKKLAEWEPEHLRKMLVDFVAKSGFDGIAPLPAEISYSIAWAKQLPGIVEF